MGKYPTRPHFAHSNMCPNMTNSGQIRYFGTSLGQPHMVKRGIPEKILPMQFRSIDFVWIVKSYDQISILPDFPVVYFTINSFPTFSQILFSEALLKCTSLDSQFFIWSHSVSKPPGDSKLDLTISLDISILRLLTYNVIYNIIVF